MGYAARNKTLISFQIDNRHARELEKRGAKWRMSRGQYVRELAIATLEDRQREELDERLRKLEANLREISQRLLATNSNLSRMGRGGQGRQREPRKGSLAFFVVRKRRKIMEQQLSLFETSTVLQSRSYEASLLEVAGKISHQFWAGKKLNSRLVRSWMTQAFGGSDAEGCWQWKDVYEAQEAAFVLLCAKQSQSLLQGTPIEVLKRLARLEHLGLTHTKRSEESVALQQFSTPPPLGYLALLCAQIRDSDVVLEPSAGTGILARLAQTQGATVVLNEWSQRRQAILRKLFPGQAVYSFNAEQIHDYLPLGIAPTVVIMNPPFSASPLIDRRNPLALAKHVRSAFQRLVRGGRLVLISAHWFCPGRKEWSEAFRGLADARVGLTTWIEGRAYAKHESDLWQEQYHLQIPRSEPCSPPLHP